MGKSRRSWSYEEKKALIDALKFSIIKGWRGENGFRTGHFFFLEEQMKKAIPDTTLTAEPHIKSTVHVWKRQYGFLSGLLSKSGVNWNPIKKKVECTQESWDEDCKAYLPMKNKMDDSWPFYEDWIEIFGKDRATGENSINFVEAVHDLMTNNNANEVPNNEVDAHKTNEDFDPNYKSTEGETTSLCDTASGSSSLTRKKRKVMTSVGEDSFMEVMSGMVGKTDDALVQIVKSLAPENDEKVARESLFEALDVFPILTLSAKVAIGRKLAKDKEELAFFLSLPHEARLEFVTQMSREL